MKLWFLLPLFLLLVPLMFTVHVPTFVVTLVLSVLLATALNARFEVTGKSSVGYSF